MTSNLSNVSYFVNEKVNIKELNVLNYISTENMLPNKGGVTKSSGLPNANYTQSFCEGDILLSNIRPYFKKIWYATFNGGCSNDVLVLRAKNNIYSKFLYYVLSDDKFFDYDTATSKGTKMPRGDKIAIMKYSIPQYDMPTQEKIARVLSSLDDKIELNNKINQNLEQQAQAIFKSWFVDFEPFDGEMPDDWRIGNLNDLSKEIICGKTPSTQNKEFYGKDVPFITIPDMHGNVFVINTERYLSTIGANTQNNKFLPPNSICVSCIATAGLVSITSVISQTNQQINSIIPRNNNWVYYIYIHLKNLSKHIQMLGSSGSTTCNLNKGQFSKINILCPNENVINEFYNIVFPIFSQILINQQENIKLTQLRDTLLPKLMSGEIDVDKVLI